jgi:hypothetical protein
VIMSDHVHTNENLRDLDRKLDKALELTFPASDPIALSLDGLRGSGKYAEAVGVNDKGSPPMTAHDSSVVAATWVREVVGTVTTREALDELVTSLMRAGFDRSDIDLLASRDAVAKKLNAIYATPILAAENSAAPRRELIRPDDDVTSSALVFGTLMTIGTLGAVLPVVASGGAVATAIVAALAGGTAAAGIAKVLKDHLVDPQHAIDLENDLRIGGLVVFVRARTRERESKAQDVMRLCGARNVHVHEVELKTTLQDLPLADFTPDPWLGNEKLAS